MRRIAGLIAAAGLALGIAAVAAPAASAAPAVHAAVMVKSGGVSPDVTYKIQNTDNPGGGCLKDQGEGNEYSVSACSIASNFTREDCGTRSGQYFCAYHDGSGYCVDQDGSVGFVVVAEPCIDNNNELWVDPTPWMFSLASTSSGIVLAKVSFQGAYDAALEPTDLYTEIDWKLAG